MSVLVHVHGEQDHIHTVQVLCHSEKSQTCSPSVNADEQIGWRWEGEGTWKRTRHLDLAGNSGG